MSKFDPNSVPFLQTQNRRGKTPGTKNCAGVSVNASVNTDASVLLRKFNPTPYGRAWWQENEMTLERGDEIYYEFSEQTEEGDCHVQRCWTHKADGSIALRVVHSSTDCDGSHVKRQLWILKSDTDKWMCTEESYKGAAVLLHA